MAKPKKFETVRHGSFTADIRLDPTDGTFSCEYGGAIIRSHVLNDVRRWAKTRLRELSSLNWIPVMEVNFTAEDTRVNNLKNCSGLECWIDRFYVAWDGKKWVRTPWVVMRAGTVMVSGPQPAEMRQADHPMSDLELAQQRIAISKEFFEAQGKGSELQFPLVSEVRLGQCAYHVAYTEEHWQTMIGILDMLRLLRTRIGQLLSSATGWTRLAAVASVRLLPEKTGKSALDGAPPDTEVQAS